MEVLTITVFTKETLSVAGGAGEVKMIPFTGEAAGPLFRGRVLPGGVDTQMVKKGRLSLSARYMLEGVDCEGRPCRLFVENNGAVSLGEPLETVPVVFTDSKALQWLETAALRARVEPLDSQTVVIHIFSK